MYGRQCASPAVESCDRRCQVVLKKPCVTVRAGEKPEMLVAALPTCSGKVRRYRCSGARSRQQAAKEIPARAEERNQPFADRPWIVTGPAVERRWRNFSGAACSGKKG